MSIFAEKGLKTCLKKDETLHVLLYMHHYLFFLIQTESLYKFVEAHSCIFCGLPVACICK